MTKVHFELNGSEISVDVDPGKPLIKTLREDMELTGSKKGCSSGVCGACTVMIDGKAKKSCLHLTGMVEGAEIRTIEGVATDEELNPIQESFLEEFSLQCGFCTPGFIMSTLALLEDNTDPTSSEIKTALHGNLCRCTGYQMIYDGVERSVEQLSNEAASEPNND